MPKVKKQPDFFLPEKDFLLIPCTANRRNYEEFKAWWLELVPRIRDHWKGRKIRFKKDGSVKEIMDIILYPADFPIYDCYLTGFILDDKEEYCAYDNYWHRDLFELVD